MNLLLAGLASLSAASDPGFVTEALADHCEPYVRGERTLVQAQAAVDAAGFAVERDEEYADPARVIEYGQEPPPDYPARAIRLRRPDGTALTLADTRDGPQCLAETPTNDPAALTGLIEQTGRWLRYPPRNDNGRPPMEAVWASPDGHLLLTSDLPHEYRYENTPAFAHLRRAGAPPEAVLAKWEAAISASQGTPGEALLWAVQNWCLPHHGGEPCIMIVHGPGREQATADLRAWLDGAASGWSRTDKPDIWTAPTGLTASIGSVEYTEGPAMRFVIEYPHPPEE